MLIDSHCHLNYLDAPAEKLAAARAAGVGGFLCIGVDHEGLAAVLALAAEHRDVWASAGVHPDAADEPASVAGWLPAALSAPSVVAVGEMGLDYSREPDAQERLGQQRCFAYQLTLAAERELPVIIHTRAAQADTLALLREHRGVRGVLHCFTESWDMAEAAIELGYYVSMSGIVTFKNAATVRDVARRIPLDRLLVETDAPWLAPAPLRGKTNEPAFVVHTAQFVAELRDLAPEKLAGITTENFHRLFALTVAPGAAAAGG